MITLNEERVFWNEVFYAETFDLRDRINFFRYDECIFVRCKVLMDAGTEQVAFTRCTFKDCDIDNIIADEVRGIVSNDNTFDRPLDEQRKDFEEKLAAVLSKRQVKP